jgi:aryl-alcohol dehydrogenase-like predicted oxidoreductase
MRPAPSIEGPFTLGTVQLGLPYGLGESQPSQIEGAADAVLSAAAEAGIVWLDTARAYGDSEASTGRWLASHPGKFRIVTKIASLAEVSEGDAEDATHCSLDTSLRTLGVSSVDICLVHRPADFCRPPVAKALRQAKTGGKTRLLGGSAYSTAEVAALLDFGGVDAIQIPLSVVSQDFRCSSVLMRAADEGVVVFVRSVFLQGALLMSPEQLPPHLRAVGPIAKELSRLAGRHAISLASLLMGAARSVPGVSSLVLGVDSVSQLSELAEAARVELPPGIVDEAFRIGGRLPPGLADPRTWPKVG